MRPITLFTGQWADLPLDTLCQQVQDLGLDGLELACWGDHFDVEKAAGLSVDEFLDIGAVQPDAGREDAAQQYCAAKWEVLQKYGLDCFAVSNHLVGQATLDYIDERHVGILPKSVIGDAKIKGIPGQVGYDPNEALKVNNRACAHMSLAAHAAWNFMKAKPFAGRWGNWGVTRPVVNGFTGSSIWALNYDFPPAPRALYEAGYQLFAERWNPILDNFKARRAVFALEIHPTEIAFDILTFESCLKALNYREEFGYNYDPSHFIYAGVDGLELLRRHPDRCFHVHAKDANRNAGNGTVSVINNGQTEFGNPSRYWNFRSPGRGDVNFKELVDVLTGIKYEGPLSIEWEHQGMHRLHGAKEAVQLLRKLNYPSSSGRFDDAFSTK
jgi:sugar phosphate isomerase/epimerase